MDAQVTLLDVVTVVVLANCAVVIALAGLEFARVFRAWRFRRGHPTVRRQR